MTYLLKHYYKLRYVNIKMYNMIILIKQKRMSFDEVGL